MPHLRIRFNSAATGDWLATLSTEFPDAEFTLLSSHPTDDGLLGVLEITESDPEAIVRRFDDADEVRSHEVLHADGDTMLLRSMTPIPEGYRANRTAGTPPNFPATMRDGWIHTELLGTHEQLARFVDELRVADVPYEIESLAQSHDTFDLLTERQREFVVTAVERGYYDSPRGCTLAELAEEFDVNKSAASGVLHRAEGRIIKEYVGGVTG